MNNAVDQTGRSSRGVRNHVGIARVVGVVVAVLTLTACNPWMYRGLNTTTMPRTGDVRCDAHGDILDEIESHGWTTDCTPEFENKGTFDGGETWFPIWGWADVGTKTVWVWPDEVPEGELRLLLWHELAHVVGIEDEGDADEYAECRTRGDTMGCGWDG